MIRTRFYFGNKVTVGFRHKKSLRPRRVSCMRWNKKLQALVKLSFNTAVIRNYRQLTTYCHSCIALYVVFEAY